ncbi:MAG TPA: hypothetical protein PKZ01_01555 [Candidatus Hydrogenedentes bacterium]|nr:hypothetical protein [Candidatus Hydrogenedentota bacterium]
MKWSGVFVVLLAAAWMGGCGPKPEPKSVLDPDSSAGRSEESQGVVEAPQDTESLIAEWKQLAAVGRKSMSNNRCREIATILKQTDPQALQVMLDLIADPAASGEAKSVAAYSLELFVDRSMLDFLRPLTAAEHDVNTRVCALHLLASSQYDENASIFRSLQTDPDRRIRMAALVGLVGVGDSEARIQLVEWYHLPDVTGFEKARIITSMLRAPVREDIPVFLAALADPDATPFVRFSCVQMLATVGDASVIPAIRQARERESYPEIQEVMDSAIAMLEAVPEAPPAGSGEPPLSTNGETPLPATSEHSE